VDKRYNQSPSRITASAKGAGKIQSPLKDVLPLEQQFPPIHKSVVPPHDSGYQGTTEDEMEVDGQRSEKTVSLDEEEMQIDNIGPKDATDERLSRTTGGSFHSARENLTTKEIVMADALEPVPFEIPGYAQEDPVLPPTLENENMDIHEDDAEKELELDDENNSTGNHITSDGSSPPKPLVRKSSLTFAALPAREPLGSKKSIGNQQRTSIVDASKGPLGRSSYLGRYTGGKSIGGARTEGDKVDVDDETEENSGKEEISKLHSKSSTQRLHERINMLGKTQPARPTKSITSATASQPIYPELRDGDNLAVKEAEEKSVKTVKIVDAQLTGDEEDDWIAPAVHRKDEFQRPQLTKSQSVDVMERITGKDNISAAGFGLQPGENEQSKQQSPLKFQSMAGRESLGKVLAKAASTVELSTTVQAPSHQKAISVSNPEFPAVPSMTPAGSPTSSKFNLDGHLSASKHKLQSIMKSAKGLFSSSARISAQAKMETMSPSMKLRNQISNPALKGIEEASIYEQPAYPSLPEEEEITKPESPPKGRKTRSSTEREKEEKKRERELKEQQKVEADLAKAREAERQKAAKNQEKLKQTPSVASLISKVSSLEQTSKPIRQSPRRQQTQEAKATTAEAKPAVSAATTRPQSQLSQTSKTKELRRPVKPSREVVPKTKQPPVSIRIGALSQRAPLTSSSLSTQQEAGSSVQKTATSVKKPSTASQQTTASTASLKSSVSSSSTRPKAPVRKIERKPTAQEEAQKRLQQREAERQAAEEAKKQAAKLALEKKRQEQNQILVSKLITLLC
jgi:hypothetical protein